MKPPVQSKYPLAILIAILHAACGFSANFFSPVSLFLGTYAYLGSFFGFMALIFQGPGVGLAVMAAAACGGALRGDIGYLAASFAEALAAAAYYRRGGRNVALADAGFWVGAGLWIVMAERLLEGYPFTEALLSGVTIAVFAIFSSAIASLLSDYSRRLPSSSRIVEAVGHRSDVPFRRIVFETSCALAMTPFLAFMVMTSETRTKGLELEIGNRLASLTESYSRIAPLWRESRRIRLDSISREVTSGSGGAILQQTLDTFRLTQIDIVSIGVLGPDGRIAASSADIARRPFDRSGADLSSTRAYARARSTGGLSLSAERDDEGRPLFCLMLPLDGKADKGVAFSIFEPDSMTVLLDGIAGPTLSRGWLIDPSGSVVAANAGGDSPSPADFLNAVRVERGAMPAISGSSREIARMSFAQFVDGRIDSGWKAVFVVDMGPLRAPVIGFALSLSLFALVAIALIVLASAYTSKIVVSSLERLGRATRGFMERFLGREAAPLAEGSGPGIEWPEEGVQEVVVLSRAFQEAGELLDRRYRETLAALGEAERANRAKRDLLSAVSHDIRGPMTGIVGMAERLETELGDLPASADARLIKETGIQLGAFVEELLDRSALEDGRLELRSEPFELRGLFDGAISVFHAAARRKGLSLDYSFDDRLPVRVLGDRARIFQVLANIIGNAVKYTHAGSVSVSASLEAEEAGSAAVLFEVADTGPGISPGDLDRIYDRYYRVEGGPAAGEKGMGLGLFLARGLVRLMGSDIEAESSIGEGSRFRFVLRLPVVASGLDRGRADAASADAAEAPRIRARVLLVDDVDISRRHSKRILELAGCEVTEAADGKAAVDAALASEFDLILMDINLPVLDGREAARMILSRLAEGGAATRPLVYALTAFAAEGDRKSILASGFDGYIAKTGEAGPLVEVARRAASRRVAPEAGAPGADAPDGLRADEAEETSHAAERILDIKGLLDAYMGNRDFLETLLRAFVSDGRKRVGEIRELVASGDEASLAGALHSLVNIAGSGRAEIALGRLRAWESALREGRPSGKALQRAALEAADRAIEAAAAYLAESGKPLTRSER